MDNWKQRADKRAEAWAWLKGTLAPDVALLQETVPPDGTTGIVWKDGGIDGNRPWASAVKSFGPAIEEIRKARGRHNKVERELHRTFPGAMAIARLSPCDAEPVTFVSMYGLIDDGYATTTVHSLLSDLKPLLDSTAGGRLVIGGDLNCSTQLPPPYRRVHRNLFDRFRANGLVDLTHYTRHERDPPPGCPCSEEPPCGHVQTHRHNRSDKPWQDDYLFASKELTERLSSLEVVDNVEPSPWEFSDHCPLVATFEL